METKIAGTTNDSTIIFPPNFLTVSWSLGHSAPAAATAVISVKMERPCKLSSSQSLLSECASSAALLLDEYRHSYLLRRERESHSTSPAPATPETVSSDENSSMELQLSTDQIVVEFLVPTTSEDSEVFSVEKSSSKSLTPPLEEEADVPLLPATKDSLMIGLDSLEFSSRVVVTAGPVGLFKVSGMKLLARQDGGSTKYIVPPTQLELHFSQHQPCSSLDM